MTEHTNQVFLSDVEQSRLWEQCRLLRPLEEPLWDELMATCEGAFLLDIGCNDGKRAMDRFGGRPLRKLIGIEYLEEAAQRAQERYGTETASFYCLDAEAQDFDQRLYAIMRAEGIDRFDFVSCSVVLSHLKNPLRTMETILSVLRPGGTLVMLESDDSAARLLPDPEGLMAMLVDACRIDPYAGDRGLGEKAEAMLAQAGFHGIRRLRPQLRAEADETEKKGLIYDCFFSFIPEDFRILEEAHPENRAYAAWAGRLSAGSEKLRQALLSKDTAVVCGINLIAAQKPMPMLHDRTVTKDDLAALGALCDDCVGKNFYTQKQLADFLDNPKVHISVLADSAGMPQAYTILEELSADELAGSLSLPVEALLPAVRPGERVAHYRSVGIARVCRGLALADRLTEQLLCRSREALNADVVVGVCWHAGDRVPIKNSLTRAGFRYLLSLDQPWYHREDVVCPVCGGRCRCNADVYFKRLREVQG